MQEHETNTMKFSDEIHTEDDEQRIVVAVPKFITTVDGFEKKGRSWFAMSQIPTDISIQVEDITFYVHKYPLVSKCGYFTWIEEPHSKSPNSSSDLQIDNLPGGPESFETILRFCYGLPISLNANNVASLRCASEFLEMTEALEDGNLITKSEAFFTFAALSSWRDSIAVLRSCETLSPWAENLQIVRRCCESIGWKISQEISTLGGKIMSGEKWWLDEMTTLRIDYFTRIVTALKAKGVGPEIVGSCIMHYGEIWLPTTELKRERTNDSQLQWNIISGKRKEECIKPTREHRMIVESLVSLLPPQKEAVSSKFILQMLRMAIYYGASPALVSELEKRASLVLENADVSDLLIPSCGASDEGVNSTEEGHMHNVDVVQRILEYFLLYEQQKQNQQIRPLAISKLLDKYLAEIARDPQLPVTKFQYLAQSLPENARIIDDGLYRAIDTYLKIHPSLSDHERKRLCKVMNYGKLSQDACAHAAQNDRLPLRTTIQVLFSEQMKIRAEIRGKNQTGIVENSDQESSWSSTNREVKALGIELQKVKAQMAELQRDHLALQQEYQKQNTKQRRSSGWTLGLRKVIKSSLFNFNVDEEETTDKSNTRPDYSSRGSLTRRRTLS